MHLNAENGVVNDVIRSVKPFRWRLHFWMVFKLDKMSMIIIKNQIWLTWTFNHMTKTKSKNCWQNEQRWGVCVCVSDNMLPWLFELCHVEQLGQTDPLLLPLTSLLNSFPRLSLLLSLHLAVGMTSSSYLGLFLPSISLKKWRALHSNSSVKWICVCISLSVCQCQRTKHENLHFPHS